MSSADPSEMTASELAAALRRREIGALEATDAAIGRIEARDGPINAVTVRDFDRARDQARAADAALARGDAGLLLGVPMTVKEAFDVAGLPTTWGNPDLTGHRAREDAVAVARLKAAGAVILGKTNVAYMLADWQSDNPVYGRVNNPHDPALAAGGSSGGSAAAVAAGMVPLEFGSDIGGSIRVPSALCGVYGHKPSYELVPSRGHAPGGQVGAAPPLNVVGPIGRSAADLALALEATAGPDLFEARGYRARLPGPRCPDLGDYRVLVLDEHPLAQTDPEIRAAIADRAAALERAGVSVVRDSPLLPDLAAAHGAYSALLSPVMSREMGRANNGISAYTWLDALDAQQQVRLRWRALFETVDVVLAPCFGVPAFPHDDAPFGERVLMIDGRPTPYAAQLAWPGVATFANLPATATPIGRTRDGRPIGVQVIGDYLEDRTTLDFAARLAAI